MAGEHIASPMRVMHVTYKFGVGGMEVGIAKLVNGLDDRTIVSAICSCRPGDSLKERLRPGVKLYELDRRDGNDPGLVAQLYKVFRRERPHVVHSHRWGTLLESAMAARLAGVPYLVHGEHGTLETRPRNAWIQRFLWNRVNRVLSVSSRLAERMSREIEFPLERITVIRNGVDLSRFQPSQNKAAAKLALGLAPEGIVVGTVGRTVAVKDHPTLLRALLSLQARGLAFSSVIAGTGPLFEETGQLAQSLGLRDLHMLGNRDDVELVLAAFDVFVLSSRSEGLSNTIQEAMACGLPVVATHVGGADELVIHGETGLLVPAGSPDALADAVGMVLENADLRCRLGIAGHARATAQFDIVRMFSDYESLYLGLARPAAAAASLGAYEA